MVGKVGFDSCFTFKYSPRPGTRAAGFTDNVCLETKKSRLLQLNLLCERVASQINKKTIGQKIEAIVESYDSKTKKLMGRTRTNKPVFFKGSNNLIGTLVNIKITSSSIYSFHGTLFS